MSVSEQLKSLVDRMPDPDSRGMYTEDMDDERIGKAIAAIYQGGRENVLGLVEMLGEPGSEENVKPHYALHCLANFAVIQGDEPARKQLAEALASQLDGDVSDYNKSFLCQCLQWVGHREAAGALGRLLLDEALVEPAAMALVAIRDGAAEQFRAALPQAAGKCRLNVIHGLATICDTQSADALRDALSDEDREVRIVAGWGLAEMGDAGSVDALIAAADADPGWERIQAAKHCLVLAEQLTAAGEEEAAAKLYRYLRDSRTDASEGYIRQAAERELAAA